MNIFIAPARKRHVEPLEVIRFLLRHQGLLDAAVVAERIRRTGKYVVVWPKTFAGAFIP